MTQFMKILGVAVFLLYIAMGASAADRYDRDKARAVEGDAVASFELGTTYMDDLDPNPRDLAKARFWVVLAQEGKLKGDLVMMAKTTLEKIDKEITPDEKARSEGWLAEWRRTGKLPYDLN